MDSSVHNNNKRQKTTHDNDDKKIKTKCKTKLVYFSDFLFFFTGTWISSASWSIRINGESFFGAIDDWGEKTSRETLRSNALSSAQETIGRPLTSRESEKLEKEIRVGFTIISVGCYNGYISNEEPPQTFIHEETREERKKRWKYQRDNYDYKSDDDDRDSDNDNDSE